MSRLESKVALVTGAAHRTGYRAQIGGRGRAVADVAQSEAAAAVRSIDGRAIAAGIDVTDEQSVIDGVVAQTERELGDLDVVVANAGIALDATAPETSLADWRRVIDVNLTGTFLILNHAIVSMQHRAAGGSLICHASMSGQIAPKGETAYCASKAVRRRHGPLDRQRSCLRADPRRGGAGAARGSAERWSSKNSDRSGGPSAVSASPLARRVTGARTGSR
jgi:NAD(P)-dependent dehydrogenase (short-subunit alcohol dehydrogenase family)